MIELKLVVVEFEVHFVNSFIFHLLIGKHLVLVYRQLLVFHLFGLHFALIFYLLVP